MARAEIDVTADLARALLVEQHPDLADLPLRVVANGWDNVLVRAGEGLALRLPRRDAAAGLIANEIAAVPLLAPTLPLGTPVPLRCGSPSTTLGYPWPWSIVPWIDGVSAAETDVGTRSAWATELADAFVALHVPASHDAPENPYRGVPISDRDEVFRARLDGFPDGARRVLRDAWVCALHAAPHPSPAVWLHGDPHPGNLLVHRGRLAALIDFGDVTSGDPASDLATAWLTFDAAGRSAFRARVDLTARGGKGWDRDVWDRAKGWAALYAGAYLESGAEHPEMAAIAGHTLRQLALEE